MQVVEKENVKKAKKEVAKGTPTVGELFEVQKAMDRFVQTSNALKGKYVRIFHQNMNAIHPLLMEASDKQISIMKQYIELDENGEFKRVQEPVVEGQEPKPANPNAPFAYKSDDDQQKCDAELNALWTSVPEDLKLWKLTKEEFDSLIINPAVNRQISLIIDYLVY